MNIVNGIKNESIEKVLSDIENVENYSWDNSMSASKEVLAYRLKNFSDGLWRLIDDSGETTAYLYFIRLLEENIGDYYSWYNYTNNGTCSNHSNNGDILFGVTLGSKHKSHGSILFKKAIELIDNGFYPDIKKIYACSRIPQLHKYFLNENDVNIDVSNKIIENDPVVSLFYSCGFQGYKLCKSGFECDKSSLGFSLTVIKEII